MDICRVSSYNKAPNTRSIVPCRPYAPVCTASVPSPLVNALTLALILGVGEEHTQGKPWMCVAFLV